jgi:hypothetical protein
MRLPSTSEFPLSKRPVGLEFAILALIPGLSNVACRTVRRKYRRPFSSRSCPKQPGAKGPSEALIQAIVELKTVPNVPFRS